MECLARGQLKGLSMRIANKYTVCAAFLTALGGLSLTSVPVAYAAETVAPLGTPAAAPVLGQPETSASSLPSLPNPPALAAPALAAPGLPSPTALATPNDLSSPPGGAIKKNAAAIEDKVAETAKHLVKNLDSNTDAMTLEDVNSARQTVARIDAMIDVEKHLAELDRVRNERSGHAAAPASFASVIPASALMLPKLAMPDSPSMPPQHVVQHEKPIESVGDIDVLRVSGIDGQYSATLRLGGGKTRSFKVGDHIGDNATVQKITPLSVVILENGKDRTLHMKNVDVIYSATR